MPDPKPRGGDPREPKHRTADSDSERQGRLNRSARRHGAHWLARIIHRTPDQIDAAVEKSQKGGN